MKKVTILLLIAALLMASLIACSNTKEGPSGDKSEAPEASGTVEVYYVKNLFKDMLKEAIDLSQFGDSIKVNITAFETVDELDEAIQKDGMPDLLLLDGFYEGFG